MKTETTHAKGNNFIVLLIKALLAIGLGLAFLMNPQGMISTFSYLVGVVFIIYGIMELIRGVQLRKSVNFGNLVIEDGIMNLIVGLILVFWPNLGPNLVMIVIGFWFVLGGLIQLIIANKFKDSAGGRNVRGLITIILGGIIIFNPSDTVNLLSMLIGGVSLLYGLYLVLIIFRIGKS